MVTSFGFLKEASRIERTLGELSCQRTLKKLEPYGGYPEVAKIINYIQSYREDVPSTHSVFKFIESLEREKQNKEQLQSIVRGNLNKKGLLSQKQKEIYAHEEKQKQKKRKEMSKDEEADIKREMDSCFNDAEKMEAMIIDLEKKCDETWEFFNKTVNSVGRVSPPYKLTGIRNMLSSLKGNLRALKVR